MTVPLFNLVKAQEQIQNIFFNTKYFGTTLLPINLSLCNFPHTV